MTHNEIHSGNKLIAEFIGHWFSGGSINDFKEATRLPKELQQQIRYDLDWNLLMVVIKEIHERILNKKWDYLLEAMKRWKPIANELQNVNQSGVWYCTVKFIEWYNKQA